jgi:hypothetical protein
MLTLLLDLDLEREKNDREADSTIQKENDFVLLNCQDHLELLDLDVKNQSLNKRPQDPSFKGAIWPLLQVETGTV